jgi:hypothetical protein
MLYARKQRTFDGETDLDILISSFDGETDLDILISSFSILIQSPVFIVNEIL